MADVTGRMLSLLSTLQSGRSFSGDELARRLGVSPRTLRRDVERLRGYGYPVDTQPGPGGYYRLAAGRTMPPLVLDDDEAIATLLGLASLAATGPAAAGGLDAAATRAYGKLDQFLPARLRPRVASVRASLETGAQETPPVAAEQVGLLAEAIDRAEVVTFDYTDARGGRSRRRVEPYRQVHHLLRWYLLGWDLDRADWRVFRLDRVGDPLRTGTGYRRRPLPAGSALEYLRRGLDRIRQRVTLVVAAPAAPVLDALRYHDAEIEAVGDRRTRVTVSVDSWRWLLLHLAFLDADFTIDAPPDLTAACRTFAHRLLSATTPGPSR
ncbi:YafY family protein [Micromonospora sp. C28SCA-DRY-2]|uniref:helix-turn-helix transcriptional regulator n=1 Tax=Micromonospora sp. C28SCA-DRY-2 TaxID=3059522 RepID=UPI0026761579|nr:YafY family protein [Micromonospora sp. C28SCA-DRY-2]MDO3705285.1 YafY family protein [Micromonospora sp. C28SCA-DRY-2]